MKFFTILSAALLCIYATNIKAQETHAVSAQDATGISLSDIKRQVTAFKQEVNATKTRNLPLTVDTNFDSFIDESDYNEVATNALKLNDIVYHNFNKSIHRYEAISSYKIAFSEDFYSIVVTVIKGDNKMESILINYTLEGNYIESILIANDEIPENPSRTITKISGRTLTRNHIFQEGQEERIQESVYKIDADGTIKELSSEEVLIDNVIQQLGLEYDKIATDLIATKGNPANTRETIMVIPEYADKEEEESYFELNSHIILVNNLASEITHTYSESAKTNGWVSDAIHLTEITIDTAPYMVAKDVRAFGVRVTYNGSSSANPYSNETISLFVKSGNTLKKVLHNFDVMNYGGKWDTNCAGEFSEEKKTLIISGKTTNNYYDIIVKGTLIYSVSYVPEDGDCESEKDVTVKKTNLKFDGETYKSN